MTVRQLELALAGLIASVAMFAALIPNASPDSGRFAELSSIRPTVNIQDFQKHDLSRSTRNVASAVLSGDIRKPSFTTDNLPGQPEWTEISVEGRQRAQGSKDAQGSGLGFSVRAGSPDQDSTSKWSIIGGAGQETYAITPNNGFREFVYVPVAVETTVGDAHLGLGYQVNDNIYATMGYVREERRFDLGTRDWEEEEHFLGVSVHARW